MGDFARSTLPFLPKGAGVADYVGRLAQVPEPDGAPFHPLAKWTITNHRHCEVDKEMRRRKVV